MTLQTTLDFLRDLAANNNKAWFDDHRDRYDQARSAFELTVDDLIHRFTAFDDMGHLRAKDCMFRINRDVRFSKDKSPYKTNFGAVIAHGGRKGTGRVYYLQVGADESFAAGGLHQPDSTQLDNIRRHINQDATPLRELLAAPDFVSQFGAMQGDQLKTAPRGYDKEHPDVDLLRYKQYLAIHPLPEDLVVSDRFVDHLVEVYRAMKPFNVYLERVAQESDVPL